MSVYATVPFNTAELTEITHLRVYHCSDVMQENVLLLGLVCNIVLRFIKQNSTNKIDENDINLGLT